VIERIRRHPLSRRFALVVALALLGLITGFSQIKTEGLGWQEANYVPRLEAVAAGEGPAPWRYRVLTDHVVVMACGVAEAAGLPRPAGLTFVALRLAQNFALFALAFYYYRKLDIHAYAALLGLSALAWGMTQSNAGTDLAFNAYSDILFYLLGALVLLRRRYHWLIPLTVLAALNRETSGLLPAMAAASALPFFGAPQPRRDLLRIAAIAFVLYGSIQIALRLYLGPADWVAHPSGAVPGFALLQYNLGNDMAWGRAAGTLGVVPALALAGWRWWHPALRPLFWAVAPAWIVIHLFCAPLEESRVLLLPLVLVFIPAMLCGIVQGLQPTDVESQRGAAPSHAR